MARTVVVVPTPSPVAKFRFPLPIKYRLFGQFLHVFLVAFVLHWSFRTILQSDPELTNRLHPPQAAKPVESILLGSALPGELGKSQHPKIIVVLVRSCLGCSASNMVYASRLQKALQSRDYRVIFVPQNSPTEVARFVEQGNYLAACDVVPDPDGSIAAALKVTQLPQAAEFRNGAVVWSMKSGSGLNKAFHDRLNELGLIKEAESLLEDPGAEAKRLREAENGPDVCKP